MKKVFIQFGQWILKHKKRLIYGGLALFIGQICFFNLGGIGIQNEVFAQSDREGTDQKSEFSKLVTEKVSLMDFYKKTAYVFLYPLMFLAGKLVDNSIVYGEVFNFDTVLWNLWNVMRNLANFGLGFIFIYYIFKYLITQDKKEDPKRLIKRSLVAGILIQASWFFMAALIDLSTIMIYGIGGLPLSVLSSTEDLDKNYNGFVMKNIISVDANDVSNINFYLTNIPSEKDVKPIYISQCDTFSIKDNGGMNGSQEYILGPKMVYYQDQNGEFFSTKKELCDYYGSVYKFSGLIDELLIKTNDIDVGKAWENCNKETCAKVQSAYEVNKNNVKGNLKGDKNKIKDPVSAGKLLEPYKKVGDLDFGWDEDNKHIGEESKTQKMSELMKSLKTKTYVGAFTSLYASLLEDGRGMLPDTDSSIYVQFLSCFLTLGHALALVIPLAVAVLVLLMRVVIIWMAIVLSPMIVLLSAFGFLDKYKEKDNILGYFQIENLLGIIFSPVFICFAVSMSKVLVGLIEKISYKEIVFKNNFQVLGIIQMDLAGFSVGLAQLIIGIMGVAISWFLVWMAVKSSKLGKSGLITSVEKLAKNGLGTIPLVPVPGKDGKGVEFIGANSAFGLNGHKSMLETISSGWLEKYDREDQETLNQLLDPEKAEKAAEDKRNQIQQEKIANKFQGYSKFLLESTQIGGNWTSVSTTIGGESVTFNSFDDANKDKIIQKINDITDNGRKDKFGEVGTVKVGDKTYTYDTKEHKFK